MNTLRRMTQLLLVPLLIGLCGCENHNLFSKLSGDSSDTKTLTQEAAIALRDKDYSKALELSDRVLGQDPNNTDALNTRASANMGLAGINLGLLVSNVLNHTSSLSSMEGIKGAVSAARDHIAAQDACGGAGSLIEGINCEALNRVIDSVNNDLQVIVSGSGHGSIQSRDAALLIDYGMVRILRAALRAAAGGYLQFRNINGDFSVVAASNMSDLCGSDSATALAIVRDVGASYAIFNVVVGLLHLQDNSIILGIRDDIDAAGVKVFTDDGSLLPHQCFTNVFDAYSPPLNATSFKTAFSNEAFSSPT